jgi:rhamnosyltransferase
MLPSFSLIVPTLNAEERWASWLDGLRMQDVHPDFVLIIDSESRDRTAALARDAGFEVRVIPQSQFNHGGTRAWGASLVPNTELLVFMTDDAILASPGSLRALIKAFDDPLIGGAFGRQLPRKGAGPFESHARIFNYPALPHKVSLANRSEYGAKAVFFSNSFSAYRREAFEACGGFPTDTILCEDMFLAAKLLLQDWQIAYVPDAVVEHSHGYTALQEFKRYFDLGVFQTREDWISKEFGGHGGEGLRFVRSEAIFLARNSPAGLIAMPFRTIAKALGFYLGKLERFIPVSTKKALSMHRRFWETTQERNTSS